LPSGIARTGEITGWKKVEPAFVVPRNCTPPDKMGVSDCPKSAGAPQRNNRKVANTFLDNDILLLSFIRLNLNPHSLQSGVPIKLRRA
jgi:hypothetical protein